MSHPIKIVLLSFCIFALPVIAGESHHGENEEAEISSLPIPAPPRFYGYGSLEVITVFKQDGKQVDRVFKRVESGIILGTSREKVSKEVSDLLKSFEAEVIAEAEKVEGVDYVYKDYKIVTSPLP